VDITGYISDLLYEHECVVLPGLGAFITNDKPATVNRITHRFSPPSRKIIFNTHLNANDGLLINYLAQTEGITYKEARQHIDEFIESCKQQLEGGKRLTFKKIGVLYKNPEGHIVFEQNEEVNYNPDAFGLGSFYSPAIDRGTDEERLKGIIDPLLTGKLKPKDRKEGRQKAGTRKKYRTGVAALILFLLLIVGGGLTLTENARLYWQNYTALIPVFSLETLPVQTDYKTRIVTTDAEAGKVAEEAEVVSENKAEEPSENLAETVEVIQPAEEEELEKPTEINTNDHQLPEIHASAGSYMIITGSFSKEKNAARLYSSDYLLNFLY
jgi:nucleoid DNA-binding protein